MIELFHIGFLSFTLLDAIDIIIVTALIAWLYSALRDTAAIQVLFVLLFVIISRFVAEALNFKSLYWLLKTITDVWLLGFIIIFQPELRRLLFAVSRTRFFKLIVQSNLSDILDETVDAARELSEKHTGALIVFTKSQSIKVTIETGIAMQAVVSKELLSSIFNPRSPLHDGAVIIENSQILAARCVLPLSAETKFNEKNLGTRHRAGLGISEQADAVVLIVSEETGWISIAYDGKLVMDVSPRDLFGELYTRITEQSIENE